jgi:hypothetical protein
MNGREGNASSSMVLEYSEMLVKEPLQVDAQETSGHRESSIRF